MRTRLMLATAFAVGAAATATANAGHTTARYPSRVRVVLATRTVDLYHSASIRVSGTTSRSVAVRLVGAIDRAGLAYRWTPYPWQVLRVRHGTWRGELPAPPLFGIYRLQLRLDHGRSLVSSVRWLLRVFPRGTMRRPSFATAAGAVRHFVGRLPGHKVLVASRRWPLARFDHRDPRLNRQFAIAYAPRGDARPTSRLGLFVTTVRDGFHGRWRLLQATTQPYD